VGQLIQLGRTFANGTRQLLTATPGCDAACLTAAQGSLQSGGSLPLGQALSDATGVVAGVDPLGVPVLAGLVSVPSLGLALVVQIPAAAHNASILANIGAVLATVNEGLPAAEQIELSAYGPGQRLDNLTARRFADQCPNATCEVSQAIQEAAFTGTPGFLQGPDYRGVQVTAGYAPIPSLDAFVAYSVTDASIAQQCTDLAVQSGNEYNQYDAPGTFELSLGVANANGTADVLTVKRFQSQCPHSHCTATPIMQAALDGVTAVTVTKDYRGVPVMAATGYIPGMEMGVFVKKDMSELMAPIISTALLLVGVSIGSLGLCTLFLIVYVSKMVSSMMRAEKEGQDAIVREKQRFTHLVEAMYPSYVVGRVLAGEQHIVQALPNTAVFFSDIYDFTTVSNKISSAELLDLMGYLYGVMDCIADYYHVTKVKTIGDAYLAVSGLPGDEAPNCCLAMLQYAACVAQVFSCQYDHPPKGEILSLLARRGRKRNVGASSAAPTGTGTGAGEAQSVVTGVSNIQSHVPSQQSKASAAYRAPPSHSDGSQISGAPSSVDSIAAKSRCLMSYGIAAGPVTAGVLQGKSPMFDIWGKTVNLASRMQSTGIPGRIQVAEPFYRSIIAIPEQSYVFEESHDQLCKGFGMVRSYYVQSTLEAVPEDLMAALGLQSNLGLFHFQDAIPTRRPAGAAHRSTNPAARPREREPACTTRGAPKLVLMRPDPASASGMDDVLSYAAPV